MKDILQKSLEDYPSIVSLKKTKIIIDQIEKSICKIYSKDGATGTGFYCFIKNENKEKIPVLITNNHIIDQKQINKKQKLKVYFNNDEKYADLILDADKKNIYTDIGYDITIIELKEKEIKNQLFLEIDDGVYFEDKDKFKKRSAYTIQYPKEFGASVSYGIIKYINEKNEVLHFCHTSNGSSGSPILNLENNKVIAIHSRTSKSETCNYNTGIFLNAPINKFLNLFHKNTFDELKKMTLEKKNPNTNSPNENISNTNQSVTIDNNNIIFNKNEITITLKIPKSEVNKEIYFLCNKKNNNLLNYLNELNPENTELFIGDSKRKYQNYFKPPDEGIYKIILKFKNHFKNCCYMFSCCKEIIRIDLSNFKTNQVTDMSYMFHFCTNLKELNLSNLDTYNVKNMSNMFSNCSNLSIINTSSFNIKNVYNMEKMFLNCRNLTNIDFSSSIAYNLKDNSNIFVGCWNFKKLKLNINSKEKFKEEIKKLLESYPDNNIIIEYNN